MRLEEIQEQVVHAETFAASGSDVEAVLEKLLRDIDAAIAERAMPVTREWLTKRYGKSAKLMRDRVWTVNEKFEVREEDSRFLVRRSLGHFVAYVTTRGDLIDLLSGLGVRK